MKKVRLLIAVTMLCSLHGLTQSRPGAFGVRLSNNVTSFPITGIPRAFYSQLHPGLDVYRSRKLNRNERNELWLSANAGAYYHRFIQTVINIYPSISYSRILSKRFSLETSLGGGYALAFEHMQSFTLNDNGQYSNRTVNARSQFLGAFSFGTLFRIRPEKPEGPRISLFVNTFVQGPFVKNYVPLLPLNSVSLGLQYPLKPSEKK